MPPPTASVPEGEDEGRRLADAKTIVKQQAFHMKRALDDLMGSLELMRSIYAGPIDIGDDLGCYPLAPAAAPAE